MSKNENLCKAILDVRFRYLNVWQAVSVNNSEPRYNVGVLIKKDDETSVAKMKAAYEEAKKNFISKYGEVNSSDFKNPIKDGDKEEHVDDSFKGCFFINASCRYTPPQVVDYQVQPITDKSALRIGDYGKISITFYPYNTADGKGVAALLGNIQVIRRGEPIFERASATEEFEVVSLEENFLD